MDVDMSAFGEGGGHAATGQHAGGQHTTLPSSPMSGNRGDDGDDGENGQMVFALPAGPQLPAFDEETTARINELLAAIAQRVPQAAQRVPQAAQPRTWLEEEDELLLFLHARGLSHAQISAVSNTETTLSRAENRLTVLIYRAT
jgi:hypothetical protein